MNNKILAALCLTFGLLQSAFGQVNGGALPTGTLGNPNAPRLEKSGYLVGPGDVIAGKVLNEPQFDFTATIDEDGKFQVPFFDRPIMAKCKTETELRAEVLKLLSKYLKSPLVSVSITERKSRPPASIFGEVRSPQNIDLRRKATLLEVISFAGGTNEDAGGMVQVLRTQPPMCSETNETADFAATGNYNSDVPSRMYSLTSVKKGLEGANPVIIPGDIIVVQKAAPIYITGQVVQPTGIRIPERGLSLSQAIAMVGGVNREAKTKDIKIYRLKPNTTNLESRDIIAANYDSIKKGTQKDVMLQPYDIVEVDKSKKSIGQIILEVATGAARTGISSVTSGLGTRVMY